MTMEEVFIVTWGGAILLGIALGLLVSWLLEKDHKEEE